MGDKGIPQNPDRVAKAAAFERLRKLIPDAGLSGGCAEQWFTVVGTVSGESYVEPHYADSAFRAKLKARLIVETERCAELKVVAVIVGCHEAAE